MSTSRRDVRSSTDSQSKHTSTSNSQDSTTEEVQRAVEELTQNLHIYGAESLHLWDDQGHRVSLPGTTSSPAKGPALPADFQPTSLRASFVIPARPVISASQAPNSTTATTTPTPTPASNDMLSMFTGKSAPAAEQTPAEEEAVRAEDEAKVLKLLEDNNQSATPLVVGGDDADDESVGFQTSSDVYSSSVGSFPESFLGSNANYEPKAPPPSYLRRDELFAPKQTRLEEILYGLERMSGGGLKCVDKVALKKQKGVIMDMLKQAGSNMLEGKNVVNISLPVRIFEPRSMLERICDWWAFAPTYLNRAAQTSDPLERLKFVITFAVAGLYVSAKQEKPFNPLLGETYQARFGDGSQIWCEHTSHHPPISNFQVLGPNNAFNYWGFYEYTAGLKGNSVVGGQVGPNYVDFPDGHRIEFRMPQMRLGGMLFGDRTLQWEGVMIFEDKTYEGVQAEVIFNPGARNKGFFSRRTGKLDDIAGEIFKVAGSPSKKKKDTEREVLATISGNWLETVEINGTKLWDINQDTPSRPIPLEKPLDSDCRFREDLIWIKRNDVKKAQEWKLKLEVRQRADRKLRQDIAAALKKSNKNS
eukprot:GILK01000592.1.p1 GENE.GILK01000592.1~~GILK01000592.1.p1  ORF type:complete len:588 (-),score=111.82 GILK01000592.1:185-1948(-)